MNDALGINLATSGVTNGAEGALDHSMPYRVEIGITGTADILFHRWDDQAVEAKAKAAKGSAAKKTDNLESYVWRDGNGDLCVPGKYMRMSLVNAAKFSQDPRSPRKSAMDLFKAGLVPETSLASLGVKAWDYEDRQRVMVQRNGITRVRPALLAGWKCSFIFGVVLPEYISASLLLQVATRAGQLVGVADHRPTYGRFGVSRFEVIPIE
jgi:hypothetical protein